MEMTAPLPDWLLDALCGLITLGALLLAFKIGLFFPIAIILLAAWTIALLGRKERSAR